MLVGGTTRLRQPVHEPRASTGAASSAAAGNRTAVAISSPTRRRRQLAPRCGLSAGCAWSAVKASGTILPPDLVSRRWGRGETRDANGLRQGAAGGQGASRDAASSALGDDGYTLLGCGRSGNEQDPVRLA